MLEAPKRIDKPRFETERDFEDYIDECDEPVYIWGSKFFVSDIIKNCDPIMFRCAMNDEQEYTEKWVCPICGDEHDYEDDALNCCQEVYECDECGEKYDNEDDMLNCSCKEL